MAVDEWHGYWVIPSTLFVAMVLAVLPLPVVLQHWRPEWLALVVLYWAIALPHRAGVFTALIAGLCMDVLEGALLGQNALALIVITVLALLLYQRIRLFTPVQQSAVVFILIGIHQLLCQWLQTLEGAGARELTFLLPALTSAACWLLVLPLLRGLRRTFHVT